MWLQIVSGQFYSDRRVERLLMYAFSEAAKRLVAVAPDAEALVRQRAADSYQAVYGRPPRHICDALDQLPTAERDAALIAAGVFRHGGSVHLVTTLGVISVGQEILGRYSSQVVLGRATETALRFLQFAAQNHLRAGGSLDQPLTFNLDTIRIFHDPQRRSRNSRSQIVRALTILKVVSVDIRFDGLLQEGLPIVRDLLLLGNSVRLRVSPAILGCIPGLLAANKSRAKMSLGAISYFRDNPARILVCNLIPRLSLRQRYLLSRILMGIRRRDPVGGDWVRIYIGPFGDLLTSLGYRGARSACHSKLLQDLCTVATIIGGEVSPIVDHLSVSVREKQPICVRVDRDFFQRTVAEHIRKASGLNLQFLAQVDGGFSQYLGYPGSYLKLRRIAAGLSQRELATLASVSRRTIGRWENGRLMPSNPVLRRVLSALEARSATQGSLPPPQMRQGDHRSQSNG